MLADCVFCKIIAGQLTAEKITETDDILVIKDIRPKAPIHYLILSKKHVENIKNLEQNDVVLAGNILLMAKQLSLSLPGSQSFRLVSNNGKDSGQIVFHLHFHFLSGTYFSDL